MFLTLTYLHTVPTLCTHIAQDRNVNYENCALFSIEIIVVYDIFKMASCGEFQTATAVY